MSNQMTSAIIHTAFSFISLCVFFLPSIVCAVAKYKHTRIVFLVNLAFLFVVFLLSIFVALTLFPLFD
jgi:hypothetical protein